MDMNVTDKWMLEQMQQMAASMASSMPQLGTNTDQKVNIEKGESFQDVMDKTKAQQTEAAKKPESAPAKQVESSESKQGVKWDKPPATYMDGKTPTRINMDNSAAALLYTGYGQVEEIYEDGTALVAPSKVSVALAFDGNSDLANADGIYPIVITDPAGIKTTVTPEQLQEVFEQYGLEGPQHEGERTLVWQMELENKALYEEPVVVTAQETFDPYNGLDPSKYQNVATDVPDERVDEDAAGMVLDSSLFRSTQAAPVKVGDNFQLDVQEPDMTSKLAETIHTAAQQGQREIVIKLSPENLGSLTIKLTQSVDGTLQVVLRAANSKAIDLLTQNLDGLKLALQSYGQGQEVRVEVQRSENSQQAGQQFQQADPDGHNQQQQQQQQQQDQQEYSEEFVQKLRLGLEQQLEDIL